jgi:broad specificity phosphatase PhoE
MSTLTLIRHGQASFFADVYDQLSPLGEEQSRLLGGYWARHGLTIDAVYTGPRTRQQRSAEIAGSGVCAAGGHFPEPIVLPALDEFDLHGIMYRLAPELGRQSAKFAGLFEDFRRSEEKSDRLRKFQRMFEPLLIHWQTMAADDPELESWPAFRQRVEGAIRQIVETSGSGRRVVLFTSGGFIGSAVRLALAAPDRAALELAWRLRNASLTEFVFTRDRFTLESFNAIPHLEDPALWSHR